MKYIACCSFGKDSLAQIIVGKRNNEPIDLVIYSEVMFTDEISGEYPEHRDFIYNVAIPKLKELYGLETVVLRADKTMWDDFHTARVRGENAGKLRGFPIPGLCNINRDCKVPPMKEYLDLLGDDVVQYIGIASDEEKRLARLDGVKQVSLLAKYGITEKMATNICREAGLLSPIYDFTKRNGCFFCPNSSDNELRHLYRNHPDLWSMLRSLQEEKTSRDCFTRTKTVFDYERQFQNEINGEVNKQHTSMTKQSKKKSFLYQHQEMAINNMKNGCILCGGVGSGKSRTGLAYYFRHCGGDWVNGYSPMTHPKDLYIITTAHKRDTLEWEEELLPFLISKDPNVTLYKDTKVVIDSWNNIQKYKNVHGAFFIFDEQRLVGWGAWVKAFLDLARKNKWILLSATPGDTWSDYLAVFIANGFYRNKTEFINEHVVYNSYTKYRKIERYINTGRLMRQRNSILVDMDFERQTVSHHEDVYVRYDIAKYKELIRNRWNIFENKPIKNANELCYLLRRVVNLDESRQIALLELIEKHPRVIIFYNFNYERDMLRDLYYGENVKVAEWNGDKHEPIPDSDRWIYLVQYTAGCEGWNCITTDTIIFYSQNYSYKVMEQASGRINRMNTPYKDLYYYHFKSRSGIDLAISKALSAKKRFNERKFTNWE